VRVQKVIFSAFENGRRGNSQIKIKSGRFLLRFVYGMAAGKYQVLRIQRGKEKSIS